MPDNIHAYDPKDLVIVSEGMYSNNIVSQPNLRAFEERERENKQRRTNSAFDLKAMRSQSVESIPSIVMNVPEVPLEDTGDILREIAVMEESKRRAGLSSSDPQMTVVHLDEGALPGAANTDDELEEVKVIKPRRKISRSSPDVTVINVGEETIETSFGGEPTSGRLKLNKRPVSPPSSGIGDKMNQRYAAGSKFKSPSTKHAADKLQQVIVETPKRSGNRRKGAPEQAVIELEDLEDQSPTKSRAQLQRPTSPPNKLVVPTIKVVAADEQDEHTTVVKLDQDVASQKESHLYQKRKTRTAAPKPGHVVDMRKVDRSEAEQTDVKKKGVRSKKSVSSHLEELSIGEQEGKAVSKDDSKTDYTEVTETSPRRTSPRAVRKDHARVESDRHGVGVSSKSHPSRHQEEERMKPPHSLTKETTDRIRHHNFPQTLTLNLMQSELSSPPLDCPTENPQIHHSSSKVGDFNHRATKMDYVSETPREKRPNNQPLKSGGRRRKELSSKMGDSSNADIEMATLVMDPAQLATPEFKLKAFQRTRNDPHPSTPFLYNKTESKTHLNETQLEQMDPFFVASSPAQASFSVSESGSSPTRPSSTSPTPRDKSPSSRSRVKLPNSSRVKSPTRAESTLPTLRETRDKSPSNRSRVKSPNSSRVKSPTRAESTSPTPRHTRNKSPSNMSRVKSPTSHQSDLLEGEVPTETRSNGRVRSKGHADSNGAVRSSTEQSENNNGVDRGEFKPIPNPAVTKLKQSWL